MTFPRPKPDTPPSMVFVNRAIDCQMKRDNAGGPQEAAERTGDAMALPAEKERYTFADVLTWDEIRRIEIIDGEAVMMAPRSRIHQKISFEIGRQIGNYLEGKKCEVYPAPFGVRLFEKDGDCPDDIDTLVEPDISVICDNNKLDKHGCKGSPDMVVEVLSPSTALSSWLYTSGPGCGTTGSSSRKRRRYRFTRWKAAYFNPAPFMGRGMWQRSMCWMAALLS